MAHIAFPDELHKQPKLTSYAKKKFVNQAPCM